MQIATFVNINILLPAIHYIHSMQYTNVMHWNVHLNYWTMQTGRQASKAKQHQVTKFPYPSWPKGHSTSIVEALKTRLATVSYLSGAGVDWLSGKADVGLNLPGERGREKQNNSRVNEKSQRNQYTRKIVVIHYWYNSCCLLSSVFSKSQYCSPFLKI